MSTTKASLSQLIQRQDALLESHENGAILDEEQLLFLAGEHVTNFDDDVDDLALNVDHVFETDQCDAFDSDVDEAPTTQTMYHANLHLEKKIQSTMKPGHHMTRILCLRNFFKSDLHSAQLQLRSTLNHHKIMREEAIILKKDFKQKEDKFLEEFLDIKRLKEKITLASTNEQTSFLLTQIEDLKAQLEGNLKVATRSSVKTKVLAPGMYAIDVKPIPHPLKNNRSAHLTYINHLKETVETVREIIEEARVVKPLDN
ncbi:hypothetical protein Tco_0929547 [Tanacetum coccineum]